MTNPHEADGGMFGPDPDEVGDAWEAGDERPPDGDLGDGHFIRINEDAWRALLHHPTVVAAITARANAICDTANTMAVEAVDPRTVKRLAPNGEPAFVVSVPEG